MNAHPAKKTAALILLASSLPGCASLFEAETDAASPIAPRVQALVEANREYPRWADFPRGAALPEPVEVAARVQDLRTTGGDLADEAARIEWTLGDPTALAQELSARVDGQRISPVTAETQAEVEAFAEAARRRAAAPPPIDRAPVDRRADPR